MADNTSAQPELVSGLLYNVGNHLALREEIDPDFRVTKIIRSNLSVVDLIPVDYSLMWQSIFDKKQYAISYDAENIPEEKVIEWELPDDPKEKVAYIKENLGDFVKKYELFKRSTNGGL